MDCLSTCRTIDDSIVERIQTSASVTGSSQNNIDETPDRHEWPLEEPMCWNERCATMLVVPLQGVRWLWNGCGFELPLIYGSSLLDMLLGRTRSWGPPAASSHETPGNKRSHALFVAARPPAIAPTAQSQRCFCSSFCFHLCP